MLEITSMWPLGMNNTAIVTLLKHTVLQVNSSAKTKHGQWTRVTLTSSAISCIKIQFYSIKMNPGPKKDFCITGLNFDLIR